MFPGAFFGKTYYAGEYFPPVDGYAPPTTVPNIGGKGRRRAPFDDYSLLDQENDALALFIITVYGPTAGP